MCPGILLVQFGSAVCCLVGQGDTHS